MKEISDACLCMRMTISGSLVFAVAIGTTTVLLGLSSSIWVGAGLGIAAGCVVGYLISRLPWKYH